MRSAVRALESAIQDIRYGARLLRRSPGFTLVAIVSLAVGLGSSVGLFTVMNALLLPSAPRPGHRHDSFDPHLEQRRRAVRRIVFRGLSIVRRRRAGAVRRRLRDYERQRQPVGGDDHARRAWSPDERRLLRRPQASAASGTPAQSNRRPGDRRFAGRRHQPRDVAAQLSRGCDRRRAVNHAERRVSGHRRRRRAGICRREPGRRSRFLGACAARSGVAAARNADGSHRSPIPDLRTPRRRSDRGAGRRAAVVGRGRSPDRRPGRLDGTERIDANGDGRAGAGFALCVCGRGRSDRDRDAHPRRDRRHRRHRVHESGDDPRRAWRRAHTRAEHQARIRRVAPAPSPSTGGREPARQRGGLRARSPHRRCRAEDLRRLPALGGAHIQSRRGLACRGFLHAHRDRHAPALWRGARGACASAGHCRGTPGSACVLATPPLSCRAERAAARRAGRRVVHAADRDDAVHAVAPVGRTVAV